MWELVQPKLAGLERQLGTFLMERQGLLPQRHPSGCPAQLPRCFRDTPNRHLFAPQLCAWLHRHAAHACRHRHKRLAGVERGVPAGADAPGRAVLLQPERRGSDADRLPCMHGISPAAASRRTANSSSVRGQAQTVVGLSDPKPRPQNRSAGLGFAQLFALGARPPELTRIVPTACPDRSISR